MRRLPPVLQQAEAGGHRGRVERFRRKVANADAGKAEAAAKAETAKAATK